MARDKRLTAGKLDRAEAALAALLDCADIEMRPHFERALRAVGVNRQWRIQEAELVGEDPLADEAVEFSPDAAGTTFAGGPDFTPPQRSALVDTPSAAEQPSAGYPIPPYPSSVGPRP